MILDFATLPPEINSARMYAGSGPDPLRAAATAWDTLAAELASFAGHYSTLLTTVHDHHWFGPSAGSMITAAAPYIAWAATTSGQAEQAAWQARATLAAYEAAFAMTVPPAVIAANRALLLTLVATNFFGQNTPAIAATEVAYAEMWAQDAAAMHGYAGSALPAAASLRPFDTPPRTTNDGGQLSQHVALAHTVTEAAHHLTHALSTAAQQPHGATTVPNGGPAGPAAPNGVLYISDWNSFNQLFSPFWGIANQDANFSVTVTDDGDAVGYVALTPRKAWLPEPALGLLGGKDPYLTAHTTIHPMLSSAGHAASVGQLSVPRSWTTLARASTPAGWSASKQVTPVLPPVLTAPASAGAANLAAGPPPVLTPLQISEPHYTGDSVYRDRGDQRNFRMPRPAVGG